MIAVALVGCLGVQMVMVPLPWLDMAGAAAGVRVLFVVLVVLGIVTLQVTGGACGGC